MKAVVGDGLLRCAVCLFTLARKSVQMAEACWCCDDVITSILLVRWNILCGRPDPVDAIGVAVDGCRGF